MKRTDAGKDRGVVPIYENDPPFLTNEKLIPFPRCFSVTRDGEQSDKFAAALCRDIKWNITRDGLLNEQHAR